MKTINKIIYILLIGILFAGCSDDEVELKDIVVDYDHVDILLYGVRMQVTALPVPLDATDQKFEWSSENPEIATVTQFGVVEAVGEGTTQLTVQKGSIKRTIPVTVTDPIVIPQRKGQWLFNDPANLVKAETGPDLIMVGSGFASVDGPENGKAVQVGVGSYFRLLHGIAPESGETQVHQYTLQFDFKVPALGSWYAFYQTEPANTGDADIFINSGGAIGVGATGYAGKVTIGKWHRLIISCDLPDFKYYLDGELINHAQSARGDRFSLHDYILFLADNDREDAEMDVSQIAMWTEALDALQIMKLGVIEE